jgi:L-ascorbate metabolism protein UlaG (beta-lactamase superfamily)
MELRRTANAGFLLTLDGVTIAMDGVCLVVSPYQATPPAELGRLLAAPPDLLAFTHDHADHFDPDFARSFQGPILGTEQIAQALPGKKVTLEPVTVGNVKVTPVPTRHIGKASATTRHQSLVIEGSKRIFFMGDATPAQLSGLFSFGNPDALIAPFAYATTASAVRMVNEAVPETLVLTHLPLRENDPAQLWPAVEAMLPGFAMPVLIPSMGETVSLR